MSVLKEDKIQLLITISFEILKFNYACSMRASCIPHCSQLPPSVTISELQNVSAVTSTISPCNTGQCEGGEAILSLLCLTHQTGGLCCPHY